MDKINKIKEFLKQNNFTIFEDCCGVIATTINDISIFIYNFPFTPYYAVKAIDGFNPTVIFDEYDLACKQDGYGLYDLVSWLINNINIPTSLNLHICGHSYTENELINLIERYIENK